MHVRRVTSMLRGCYEEITKKLLPWNLAFIKCNCVCVRVYSVAGQAWRESARPYDCSVDRLSVMCSIVTDAACRRLLRTWLSSVPRHVTQQTVSRSLWCRQWNSAVRRPSSSSSMMSPCLHWKLCVFHTSGPISYWCQLTFSVDRFSYTVYDSVWYSAPLESSNCKLRTFRFSSNDTRPALFNCF